MRQAAETADVNNFVRVPSGEPHMLRRRKILAEVPAARALIKQLSGFDERTAWVVFGVFFAQLLATRIVANVASWWFTIFASYAVGAVLNHWLGQAIHETSHNLGAKTRRENKWLALFANLPLLIPIAMTFHRYHIDHHTLLGVDGEDTDLPTQWEVKHIGRSTAKKGVWLFFYMFVYAFRGLTFAKPPNRDEILNVALQALFTCAFFLAFGWHGIAYLLLATFFGHSLHPVAAHFIHEHYVFQPGQETYSYYGPLNWVTFNVGYHNEHHDFMNVAGWRLPELHQALSPYYAGLRSHRSWTYVLWLFVTNSRLGFDSRIVRHRADFDAARASRA